MFIPKPSIKASPRYCIVLLLAIACIVLFKDVFAGNKTVTIVYKEDTQIVRQFYELLSAKRARYDLELMSLDSVNKSNSHLFIAIGIDSFSGVLKKQLKIPIIAVFISRLSYRDTIKNSKLAAKVTAIFSDPNPSDQIRLAKQLYKKSIDVAVLLSNRTAFLRPEISRSAKQYKTNVKFVNVDDFGSLYKTLSKVHSYDVLLAVPDSQIYNSKSMRTILLTTYRNDQSMIGFSKGMVKAGALATTTVDVADIAGETDRWIQLYLNTKKLPKPYYSEKFNVHVNEYVAESLSIYGDEQRIQKELLQR